MKLTITIVALLLAPFAQAAVTVAPVHLNVVQNAKTTSLNFVNDTDSPSVIDIRVKKWTGQNADGTDLLQDTPNIVLSRPVVTVPARGDATIRIVVKARSEAAEDTYRVLVNDITPPSTADGKVAMRMNSILPLFILNNKTSRGLIELRNGVLTNTGDRHVRIASYINTAGKRVDKLRYLFPGQSITLPVKSANDVTFSDDIY